MMCRGKQPNQPSQPNLVGQPSQANFGGQPNQRGFTVSRPFRAGSTGSRPFRGNRGQRFNWNRVGHFKPRE